MEAEGGGGGNSVTGNSSDSGSGGIIDVSTVSSNFNAPTPQTSASGCMHGGEEDKRSSGKNACPQSVEKVWFTDTSTGVWLLEEESSGCEIPDEFLDVSLESEEEQDCDENSNDEEYEGGGSRDNDGGNGGSSDAGKAAETAQLCGWVPPQCCLIPLPENPVGLSDDEGEGGEGGEGKVVGDRPLSESELQRQHKRELEVLFGFKPPSTLQQSTKDEEVPMAERKECEDGKNEGDVFCEENNREMVVRNVAKPRSNSADSGVVSISPHSSEGGDVEQRHSRNQTVILAPTDEQTRDQKVETSPDNPRAENVDSAQEPKPECGGNVERGEEGSGGVSLTPERCTQRACLQVSRLRTPSEKLQKCSVFSGSPVVCSELEELREASKMTVFPPVFSASLSPPATSQDTRSQTFTITPPTTSSNSPTRHSSSSSSHHSEKSSGSRDTSQSGSVSSVASSAASREGTNQHQKNKRKIEKKSTSNRVGKPACRGALGYKAGTGAPVVKVVKRPLSKLKSLLPASAVPSALPSQVKKPPETKRRTNLPELQNVPAAGAAMPRRTSAPSITSNAKSSGLVQPGKKIPRRSLDTTGPLKPFRNTFVKPANPNPIKEAVARLFTATNPATVSRSANTASRAGVTTTPTRGRGPVKTKYNPSTPNNRLRVNVKQPISSTNAGPHLPSTSACNTTKPLSSGTVAPELAVGAKSSNKSTGLSTSIVSSGSPSVQQSTPMNQLSHSRAAAGTVVKAANRTVTKDSSTAAARRCGEETGCNGGGIPNTPRSSIASTPSRRVRPKFSLSSIDSTGSGPTFRPPPPPAALGDTFTEGPNETAVQSTPKSPRRNKRRSFIPTPSRQNESRDVALLVYNSDSNPIGHQSTDRHDNSLVKQSSLKPTDGGGAGAAPAVEAGRQRTLVPNPRQRRPLLSRNRLIAGAGGGLGKRQPLRGQDGPLKPANAYKFSSKGLGENSEPTVPSAKVVHSPVNKDDQPNSPHSAWSPVRRKPVAEGEACFQCTKRGYRN